MPPAKAHRSTHFVSEAQHASFSRQDSNRCMLDLVTESLFYPLLTDFISLPSLLCMHTSMPFLFPFFSTPLPSPSKGWELWAEMHKQAKEDRLGFFFCCVQLFLHNIWSVFHLHKHVALRNETALGLKVSADVICVTNRQTKSLSAWSTHTNAN